VSAATVRAARREDVPRIWEMLIGLARYERLEHEVVGSAERLGDGLFGVLPKIECLVAEVDRALIGYALFYPTYSSFSSAPTMWLEDLYVDEAHRQHGAGKALLAALARLAIARGCLRMAWIVLDWNAPSIRFYERLGAQRAERGWLQFGFDRSALEALAGPSSDT
jgi:GNAT superfamily N-acetyltransferase